MTRWGRGAAIPPRRALYLGLEVGDPTDGAIIWYPARWWRAARRASRYLASVGRPYRWRLRWALPADLARRSPLD